MTIPKNAGPSRLADTDPHYPVKRKGQPRRLDPNWAGIEWLERQSETDTEVAETYDIGEAPPGSFASEIRVQRALGWYSARRKGMYPWPMFQTFATFKANMLRYLDPCPACDDWSRTSQCEEHHDEGVAGLKIGEERRRARMYQRINHATPPIDGRRFFAAEVRDAERERQRAAETARYVDSQMRRSGCTCSTCQRNPGRRSGLGIFEPVEPTDRAPRWYEIHEPDANVGRHYDFARDRWVPNAPADFTMTIEGTSTPDVLEITGDTTQASQSSVWIEATRNDDTDTP